VLSKGASLGTLGFREVEATRYICSWSYIGFGLVPKHGDASVITGADWKAAERCAGEEFSDEERQIIRLLALGQSTPSIAKALGTNRSAVWRKIQRIREKLPESTNAL
jgi:DNA-binding CsgD family transcriptional regulator